MLQLEARQIVPHVAVKAGQIGGEHPEKRRDQEPIAAWQRMAARMKPLGYQLSQKTRKRSEEAFAWIKVMGGMARTQLVGRWKIRQPFQMAAAAYNFVRLAKLLAT